MDTGIDDIKIWSGIYAADKTRAYLWDMDGRRDHREALDDAGLRNELAKLVRSSLSAEHAVNDTVHNHLPQGPFWKSSEIRETPSPTPNRQFVIV